MSKPDNEGSKKNFKDEYRTKYKERLRVLREEFQKLMEDLENSTLQEMDSINARMTPIQNSTKQRWVEEINEFLTRIKQVLKIKDTEASEDGADTDIVVGRQSG